MNTCIIVIAGPTASGKSSLALRLAAELDAEIINADSQQVYRGLDIGTAKPSHADLDNVPHHLIDIVSPDHTFSAADFVVAADDAIKDITARGKRVVVVGGTGLYIRALLHGLVDSPSGGGAVRDELLAEASQKGSAAMFEMLQQVDPDAARLIHPNNQVRVIRALEVYRQTGIPFSRYQQEHGFCESRYQAFQIGVSVERKLLYERIDARVEQMIAAGLVHEVQHLLASGVQPDAKGMQAIGYKEVVAHLAGEYDLPETMRLIKRNTRHYAKRQLTWFKADPAIVWFDYPEKYASILRHVIDFFGQKGR